MEIVSKRHPYKFFLALIFMSLFLLGIGTLFMFASKRDNNIFGYLGFLAFLALTIYFNYVWIKKSSKIVLNKNGISHKNEFYKWDEITEINLTGKRSLFFNTPSECATLSFKNLKTIYIFDDLYSNSPEMKCFIRDIAINKNESFFKVNENSLSIDYENELFIPYKGNPIFSFRGLLMWSLIVFIFIIFASSKKKHNVNSEIALFTLCFFWFIMNSFMMYYFEISKNFLVVRNHYFFWIKKVYKIENIHEIVFETQSKQPNKLRLITKNFESVVFPAGSLSDKTWLEMKQEFESKNIIVRNECIY
ncbi:hypothetical protein HKT18_11810 [Flavobacterium sp. IMCC34852]|uniref:Uncharacterized protein n=1 Tax=Flavobacterium rivulicola TaxID=2732161 RepID=A0A7Y3VZM8_9FLAO|nr:hypothetical protein [Flavobacterium sp. IMCC34852]NNT72904.1 hypothetical protein [Flavobacterium sp. IMCC34852]